MAVHVSLKDEIYRQVRVAIRTAQLRQGEYLTPNRDLAEALAVSRSTVVAAHNWLCRGRPRDLPPGTALRPLPVESRSTCRRCSTVRPCARQHSERSTTAERSRRSFGAGSLRP
jgi:DNA-binding transcriptional MocR family regulator